MLDSMKWSLFMGYPSCLAQVSCFLEGNSTFVITIQMLKFFVFSTKRMICVQGIGTDY